MIILPSAQSACATPFGNQYSMSFDGIDDYVQVVDDTALQFSKTDSFSVSFWVKESASDARFCVTKHADQAAKFNWDIGVDASDFPAFRCDSFAGSTTITGSTALNSGWNNIIATYSNGSMECYLNGSSVGTGTYTGSADYNTSNLLFAKAQYSANTANCFLDEICIWNTALDSSNAAVVGASVFDLLKKNGNYVSQDNVVGYWRMEEGTGAACADTSGNGNNASHINASNWETDTP